MNIILLIVIIFFIIKMIDGYKKGMVKELISLVTLCLVGIVVLIVAAGLHFVKESEIAGVLVTFVLLALVVIVHYLLRVVFFSAKILTKLPVISFGNQLLGMVVGVLEVILFMWILYTLIFYFDLGMIGDLIIEGSKDSLILSIIHDTNLLQPIAESLIEYLPW